MRQPTSKPTLPILAELPAGYFVEETPGGVLAVAASSVQALLELGYGPETDGQLEASDLHGRRPMYEFRMGDERLVLRRFHHGGLLRWATGARFLDAERPFRELILADALARSGIATPDVVAARARLAKGGGWYLDIVTRRLEESIDLGEALERVRRGELGHATRVALTRALGNLLRQLHSFGLVHADLQPRNLLVKLADLEAGVASPVLWVIDLDRSAFVGDLSDDERRANLRRLFRSVDRRNRSGQPFLTRVDYARFFKSYDPGRQRWKADWRRIFTDHTRRGPAHWVGQLFERTFSDGRQRLGVER